MRSNHSVRPSCPLLLGAWASCMWSASPPQHSGRRGRCCNSAARKLLHAAAAPSLQAAVAAVTRRESVPAISTVTGSTWRARYMGEWLAASFRWRRPASRSRLSAQPAAVALEPRSACSFGSPAHSSRRPPRSVVQTRPSVTCRRKSPQKKIERSALVHVVRRKFEDITLMLFRTWPSPSHLLHASWVR